MTASTQPAIETIRARIIHGNPAYYGGTRLYAPSEEEALAALSAVEAELRRKEEALRFYANENSYDPDPMCDSFSCPMLDDDGAIARAALAPVSPSEPGAQQAERNSDVW